MTETGNVFGPYNIKGSPVLINGEEIQGGIDGEDIVLEPRHALGLVTSTGPSKKIQSLYNLRARDDGESRIYSLDQNLCLRAYPSQPHTVEKRIQTCLLPSDRKIVHGIGSTNQLVLDENEASFTVPITTPAIGYDEDTLLELPEIFPEAEYDNGLLGFTKMMGENAKIVPIKVSDIMPDSGGPIITPAIGHNSSAMIELPDVISLYPETVWNKVGTVIKNEGEDAKLWFLRYDEVMYNYPHPLEPMVSEDISASGAGLVKAYVQPYGVGLGRRYRISVIVDPGVTAAISYGFRVNFTNGDPLNCCFNSIALTLDELTGITESYTNWLPGPHNAHKFRVIATADYVQVDLLGELNLPTSPSGLHCFTLVTL